MAFDAGSIRTEAELDLSNIRQNMAVLRQFVNQIKADVSSIPDVKPAIDPQAANQVQNFAQKLRDLIPIQGDFDTRLRASIPLMDQFGLRLAPMAAGLGAVAVALAAVGAAAVATAKQAAALSTEIAFIQTIKPDIDTTSVRQQLTELSISVGQSTKELAAGLYNIFSSINVTQEQAVKLLSDFSKGAVAARTDAQTFGTAILGVLNAYKLDVAASTQISDEFFNTVNKGVINGQELASTLGAVTSAAKQAGVSHQELFASIAAVTKEGGSAAQNVNNLNNLYAKLNTKEAAADFARLGIATRTAANELRSPIDVLKDLKVRLDGMSQAAAALALQEIFPDLQARQGAQVLMSQLDAVDESLAENRTQTDSTREAYELMAKTTEQQFKQLQQTIAALADDIGQLLLPAANAIAAGLKDATQAMRQFVVDSQEAFKNLSVNTQQARADAGDAFQTIREEAELTARFLEAQAKRFIKFWEQASKPQPTAQTAGGTITAEQTPAQQAQAAGMPAVPDEPFFQKQFDDLSALVDDFWNKARDQYVQKAREAGDAIHAAEKAALEPQADLQVDIGKFMEDRILFQADKMRELAGSQVEAFARRFDEALKSSGIDAVNEATNAIADEFKEVLRKQFPGATEEALDLVVQAMRNRGGQLREEGRILAANMTPKASEIQQAFNTVALGVDAMAKAVAQGELILGKLTDFLAPQQAIENTLRLTDAQKDFQKLMGEVTDVMARAHAQWLANHGDLTQANALLQQYKDAQDATKKANEEAEKAAKKAAEQAEALAKKQAEAAKKVPEIINTLQSAVQEAARQLDEALSQIQKQMADATRELVEQTAEITRTLDAARAEHDRRIVEITQKQIESANAFNEKVADANAKFATKMTEISQAAAEARGKADDAFAEIDARVNKTIDDTATEVQEKLRDLNEKAADASAQSAERISQAFHSLSEALTQIRQQEQQSALQFSRSMDDLNEKMLGSQTQATQNELAKARLRLTQDFGLQQAAEQGQEAAARRQFGFAISEAEAQARRAAIEMGKQIAKILAERDKKLREEAEKAEKDRAKAEQELQKALAKAAEDQRKAEREHNAELKRLAEEEQKRQEQFAKDKEEADRKLKEAEDKAERDLQKINDRYDRRITELRHQQDEKMDAFVRAVEKAEKTAEKALLDVREVLGMNNALLEEAVKRIGVDMPLQFNNTTVQETAVDWLVAMADRLEERLRQG